MDISLNLSMTIPPGMRVHVVDTDHPNVRKFAFAIEAHPCEFQGITQKLWDYRIWHALTRTANNEQRATELIDYISDNIGALYRRNERCPNFAQGVRSVSIVYPKSLSQAITRQLSRFPVIGYRTDGTLAKAISVETESGKKLLAIEEHELDIDVPKPSVHILLNNPEQPTWVTYMPERGPYGNLELGGAIDSTELTERRAWEKVFSWLHQRGLSVAGQPYPNGSNEFPDYCATIANLEYDIEMTAVPDMSSRTIRANNRDLESTIRRVAQQPDETLAGVVQGLDRVLRAKARHTTTRLYMVVVSNWSAFELQHEQIWQTEVTSAFDDVVLIERNRVSRVGGTRRPAVAAENKFVRGSRWLPH